MAAINVSLRKIHLPGIDLTLTLPRGEAIRTEVSGKHNRESVESLLSRSGFELIEFYTDPESLFALSLARRTV